MAASTSESKSHSLKEYLKKYENSNEEQTKKKKKKKKMKTQTEVIGVRVVDEDPIWQKPVKIEDDEDGSDSADEEKPQINEDIEVKRMKRLEEIRSRRPYLTISDDGSGWVSVSDTSKPSSLGNQIPDLSPPRQRRARYDTPSPEPESKPSISGNESNDLSPSRQRRRRYHMPSPESEQNLPNDEIPDLSPPRQHRRRFHTPESEQRPSNSGEESSHLYPLEPKMKASNSSSTVRDLSPPRRSRPQTSLSDFKTKDSERDQLPDLSPPRRSRHQSREVDGLDFSPPRKSRKDSSSVKEGRRAGLFTGEEIKQEIDKKKKEDWLRFSEMDPSVTGRGAEPVYRHQGKRVTKEEFLKLQQGEEKPKEKPLEWGKGLAQKREAEAREHELQLEKDKPFARTRDDPELDQMLKERVRWGDPMAHLVKRKHSDLILDDLGDNDKMKESGFVIPQAIPMHSWLKRGIDASFNRYSIRPGRHWDGVDRSNGYEKGLFQRQNEKKATEREAYLWSVSEM
ncbi:pre-mRNA-splicing factor of RES complex protein [Tasmannia lanceolata]|uniref:pre-mRNA-splicing factor of RES complex protein n=1 Tax=Tasmannia lanceolata TaxID=3420 RepID=UPI0040644DC5